MSFKGTVEQRMCLHLGGGCSYNYYLRRVEHLNTSLGANNAMDHKLIHTIIKKRE